MSDYNPNERMNDDENRIPSDGDITDQPLHDPLISANASLNADPVVPVQSDSGGLLWMTAQEDADTVMLERRDVTSALERYTDELDAVTVLDDATVIEPASVVDGAESSDVEPWDAIENSVLQAAAPVERVIEPRYADGIALPADIIVPAEDFESLTLAEVTGRLIRAPGETWQSLVGVALTPVDGSAQGSDYVVNYGVSRRSFAVPGERRIRQRVGDDGETVAPVGETIVMTPRPVVPSLLQQIPHIDERGAVRGLEVVQFLLRVAAVVAAVWGGLIVAAAPTQGVPETLDAAALFWLIGFAFWFVSEFISFAPPLRDAQRQKADPVVPEEVKKSNISSNEWIGRGFLIVLTILFAYFAFAWTAGNLVTTRGFIAWIASMITAVWAVAPRRWSPFRAIADFVRGIGQIRVSLTWTTIALIAILIVGAVFRFTDIGGTPPEPTSDHVEKILDAQKILDGDTQVFFSNNGGRESIQMYLMALLSKVPGFGVNFYTLTTLTAIEGLLTIPVMFWLGRVVVGREDRRLGTAVGLAAAGLVAVSYWHQTLSHLGLRIVLTSLVTALLLIFFIRGLRSNNRGQFIAAGLTLGIGLYCYQAVRMLPVVIIAGLGIALLHKLSLPNDRRWLETRRLIVNGVALVFVALIAFVPLGGFIIEYSDQFLERTNTRLFGDGMIQETDALGNVTTREASTVELVWSQREVLITNYRDGLLSYNFSSDVAWLQSAPYYPTMDAITGALLIGGVAGWLGLMVRRRDPGIDLIIPAILIMILPSALALAFPVENPSNTRMSGTLPGVYLLAGFALALLARQFFRVVRGRVGFLLAGVAAVTLFMLAFAANWNTFFVSYRNAYMGGALPYSNAARVMRGFADSGGHIGNTFMVVFPYWWDHRAIGIEAGVPQWDGSIVGRGGGEARDIIPEYIRDAYRDRTGELAYDPNADMLFFYEPSDDATENRLEELFPAGTWREIVTEIHPVGFPPKTYKIFRVPALGDEGFEAFVCAQLDECASLAVE